MTIYVILNIVIFLILLFILRYMAQKRYSFSKRVFTALFLGIVLGLIFNYVYDKEIVLQTKEFYDVVGKGYVALLRMISMPLIMVSITSSIVNLKDTNEASKMGSLVIGILLSTASIASIVAIGVTYLFNLKASDILGIVGGPAASDIEKLAQRGEKVVQSLSDKVVSFIPQNPFLDFTGARSTSIIAVVIFSMFVGISILSIKKKKENSAKILIDLINAINDVVFKMVQIVLRLTPYGVLALISVVTATSDFKVISKLIIFVIASYLAIGIMFLIHFLLVALFGLSPVKYIKKALPAITFSFASRSSAATLPLTIQSQEDMGVEKGLANIAATFGTSIGQNGCAAIYPTMLALMVAPGIIENPYSLGFLVKLVIVVTVSSLGVAGIGGGATFAALIVLGTLGLPVEIVALLVSVEALIDMGRTALNVNDSILSGVISSKILGKMNVDKYND